VKCKFSPNIKTYAGKTNIVYEVKACYVLIVENAEQRLTKNDSSHYVANDHWDLYSSASKRCRPAKKEGNAYCHYDEIWVFWYQVS